jgi:hypothetical protein
MNNARVTDFHESNNSTKEATIRVEEFLKNQHGVERVINVENDPKFQKLDIDLIVERRVDEGIVEEAIEIKVDSYMRKTKNIAVEIISNEGGSNRTPTMGCFLDSDADFFYIMEKGTGKGYVLDVKLSQISFLSNYKDNNYPLKTIKTRHSSGSYETKFYPVPIKDFRSWACIKETIYT